MFHPDLYRVVHRVLHGHHIVGLPLRLVLLLIQMPLQLLRWLMYMLFHSLIYMVYPKAFGYFHMPHNQQKKQEMLNEWCQKQQTAIKESHPGVVIEMRNYRCKDSTLLRGFTVLPHGNKENPYKDGYIYFEGTNRSEAFHHLDEMLDMATLTGKPVIGLAHRGSLFSAGKPHSELRKVLDDNLAVNLDLINGYREGLSAEDYAKKVAFYGHSLGGALSIATAYRLHKRLLPVRVFSWSSFSSLHAVARDYLGDLALALAACSIGSIFAMTFFQSSIWQAFLGGLGFGLVTYTLLRQWAVLRTLFLSAFETAVLIPLFCVCGWFFDVTSQARYLFKQGGLQFGHMSHDRGDGQSEELMEAASDGGGNIAEDVFYLLTGEDTFIHFNASLAPMLRSLRHRLLNSHCLMDKQQVMVRGSAAVSKTLVKTSGEFQHIQPPSQAFLRSKQRFFVTQMNRIAEYFGDFGLGYLSAVKGVFQQDVMQWLPCYQVLSDIDRLRYRVWYRSLSIEQRTRWLKAANKKELSIDHVYYALQLGAGSFSCLWQSPAKMGSTRLIHVPHLIHHQVHGFWRGVYYLSQLGFLLSLAMALLTASPYPVVFCRCTALCLSLLSLTVLTLVDLLAYQDQLRTIPVFSLPWRAKSVPAPVPEVGKKPPVFEMSAGVRP